MSEVGYVGGGRMSEEVGCRDGVVGVVVGVVVVGGIVGVGGGRLQEEGGSCGRGGRGAGIIN